MAHIERKVDVIGSLWQQAQRQQPICFVLIFNTQLLKLMPPPRKRVTTGFGCQTFHILGDS
ncbi:hypothetical protein Hdeb2414_s0019g00551651 [Helianthus debilis subsp. tardiflorus]